MEKILKLEHKNLALFEAGFLYCKRHNLDYETFDIMYMLDEFDSSENSEFDKICKDLRSYRKNKSYSLVEITEDEYDECVNKFNE